MHADTSTSRKNDNTKQRITREFLSFIDFLIQQDLDFAKLRHPHSHIMFYATYAIIHYGIHV